jgi:hypothetical protein
MSRARFVLLSLVAVLSAGVVFASAASAEIKYEWKVEGTALAAGQSREFTVTSDGKTFDFHSTIAGANILLLSSAISVEPGARIIGGKPGTNEEVVVFHGVTSDPPFQKCLVESDEQTPTPDTVKTHLLKTEIVGNDLIPSEPLILFTPKEGTTFVSLLLLDKSGESCEAGAAALVPLGGSFLGQPLPTLVESLNGDLDFEAPDKHFLLSNGKLDTAGVTFNGEPLQFTGLILVILKTDEKYGAF